MSDFAVGAANPAIDVVGRVVFQRRIDRLLYALDVVRMQRGEEGRIGREALVWSMAEDPTLLFGPCFLTGRNIPVPRTEMGQRLGLIQRLLFGLQVALRACLRRFECLTVGNVEMDAGGPQGGTFSVPLDHASAVEDPAPGAGLGSQAMLAGIGGRFPTKMRRNRRHHLVKVIRVHQLFPGPDMGFELVETVAEHIRPSFVKGHSPRGDFPVPGAHLGTLHDQLHPVGLLVHSLFMHSEKAFEVGDPGLQMRVVDGRWVAVGLLRHGSVVRVKGRRRSRIGRKCNLRAQREGFEEGCRAFRDKVLAEENDGKQFTVRQRRAESQDRPDPVLEHELFLSRDVGASFGFGDVKDVERLFMPVEQHARARLCQRGERDSQLPEELAEHGQPFDGLQGVERDHAEAARTRRVIPPGDRSSAGQQGEAGQRGGRGRVSEPGVSQCTKVRCQPAIGCRLEEADQAAGRLPEMAHGQGSVEVTNEAVGDLLKAGGICAEPAQRRAAGGHVSELERSQMVHATGDSAKAERRRRYSVGRRQEELEHRTIVRQAIRRQGMVFK